MRPNDNHDHRPRAAHAGCSWLGALIERKHTMLVTRWQEARQYPARNHDNMCAFRLQGMEASPTESLWVGLSIFLPGGGAAKGAAPTEKVYVVLEGELTIIFDENEVVLGPLDSILIEANESRTVENRSNDVAKMLVASPT